MPPEPAEITEQERADYLLDALQSTWDTVKARYSKDPDMTGDELYAIAKEESRRAGYEFGGTHAVHLVGHFPHERIPQDVVTFYITRWQRPAHAQAQRAGQEVPLDSRDASRGP